MQLGLSENLSALVARRFTSAKDGGHLVFSKTHLALLTASGIPYQLRYCPALAKKPSNLKPEPSTKKKFDPFENPSPDLLITHFPPSNPTHALVLNKFPVIPNHFILSTKEWKSQTDLLEKADLEATYECLRTWGQDTQNSAETPGPAPKRLFAFFNSGDDSGASQPHRHLQFLPVEAMRQSEAEGWTPLIELLTHSQSQSQSLPGTGTGTASIPTFQYLPHLPMAHFALPIPQNPSPETLHSIYISLYRAAVAATEGRDPRKGPTNPDLPTEGPSAISYNLAMTLSTMMICPRRQETARVPVDSAAAGDIVDPGVLSLNGTILGGTLMVKAEGEWDALRCNPEYLNRVLRDVGFPRVDSFGNSVL